MLEYSRFWDSINWCAFVLLKRIEWIIWYFPRNPCYYYVIHYGFGIHHVLLSFGSIVSMLEGVKCLGWPTYLMDWTGLLYIFTLWVRSPLYCWHSWQPLLHRCDPLRRRRSGFSCTWGMYVRVFSLWNRINGRCSSAM